MWFFDWTGRFCGVKGPGHVLLLPLADKWKKMDLRTKILLLPNVQVSFYEVLMRIIFLIIFLLQNWPQELDSPRFQVVTSDTGILAFNVEIFYRITDTETNVLRVCEPEVSEVICRRRRKTYGELIVDWPCYWRLQKILESLCRTTIVSKTSSSTQSSLEKDRRVIGEYVRDKLNEAVRSWGYEVSEVSLLVLISRHFPWTFCVLKGIAAHKKYFNLMCCWLLWALPPNFIGLGQIDNKSRIFSFFWHPILNEFLGVKVVQKFITKKL